MRCVPSSWLEQDIFTQVGTPKKVSFHLCNVVKICLCMGSWEPIAKSEFTVPNAGGNAEAEDLARERS